MTKIDFIESAIKYHFEVEEQYIHDYAVSALLSKNDCQVTFTQGNFSYLVMGGDSGHLYYKRTSGDTWILIANWCLYGAYIVVRYRKAAWLRPMYKSLFTRMHFKEVLFDDYSIELLASDGGTLRSRRFRLSPPLAFDRVMSGKFGLSEEQIKHLKAKFLD